MLKETQHACFYDAVREQRERGCAGCGKDLCKEAGRAITLVDTQSAIQVRVPILK